MSSGERRTSKDLDEGHTVSRRLQGRRVRTGMDDASDAALSAADLPSAVHDLTVQQETMQHRMHEAFARQTEAQLKTEVALGKMLEMIEGMQSRQQKVLERGSGNGPSASSIAADHEASKEVGSILDDRGLRELLEQDKVRAVRISFRPALPTATWHHVLASRASGSLRRLVLT